MRQRLNIPPDANLLLFLGRIHKKKRPDFAIEALAGAQSIPGETHLVLSGPDGMQLVPRLQAQAQQLGCVNRLHVTGLLKGEDLLSILADATLLLMPSEPESENFGMSAVEAMASGLPILVSTGVPVGNWAQKAGAGRAVACTSSAFRQMTCELLGSPAKLREMGQKGQVLAHEKFDIKIVAQQMLRQYRAIISSGRPILDSRI
jgi:glycosyltransferase involved in cell wall biosynthesis